MPRQSGSIMSRILRSDEERRAVHDDRDPRTALGGRLGVREHVLQEEKLPVADPRQTRYEAPGGAPVVLVLHGVLIALPVLAVGRIGDQVIESAGEQLLEVVARREEALLAAVSLPMPSGCPPGKTRIRCMPYVFPGIAGTR